jgi:steroid delta-isomerase-like uncharacterized protein
MKRRATFALVVCVCLFAGTLFAGGSGKQIEYNKALVRKVFSEIYGQGKVSLVDDLYADDFVDDSPGGGKGRDLIKKAVSDFHRAMPDLAIEIEDVFATEDKVVLRYTAHGIQTGPYGDIPATGKKAVVRGITIFLVAGGKIKTEWTEYDRLGLMRQLGVIP